MTPRRTRWWPRWLRERASDDLLGGLDGDGAAGDLGAEPVQQALRVRLGDGIGIAAAADVVEGQMHPSAAILLGRGDITLDRRHGRALLGVGRGSGVVRVKRGDRFGEYGLVVHTRHTPAAGVAAILDDLRFDR